MAEGQSEFQQPTKEAVKPKLVERLITTLGRLKREFEIDTTPIPLSDINPGRIAVVIEHDIYNPFQKYRFANGFDIRTVLASMNYVATWMDEDPTKMFPKEAHATQVALSELVKRGVLEPLRDPKNQDQTVGYRVIDEKKLKKIVANSMRTSQTTK